MLNAVIRFSLQHRMLSLALSVMLLVYGGAVTLSLPIDIFPNLTRPRVVVMSESPGLAPEEVETLVTFPIETALNGAPGVEAVRSASGVGLSVIYVEFGWNTNIYVARQIVQERLATVADRLPKQVTPLMAPISSIMGQVLMVGLWSKDGETSPMELRTLADWVVRQRLLAIPGVAQVITMGGERKQFQVLVRPDSLLAYGVTLDEVERALMESNLNATGGYLEHGSMEFLVRGIGRVTSLEDIANTVVKRNASRAVLLGEVASVKEGAQIKRGDSSVNGHPAVVVTIAKQPAADTRALTERILAALQQMRVALPADVEFDASIYQQRRFIDIGVHNVVEALRDGAILVVVVLVVFLMNVRTTFITLTAIPLSLVITAIVFMATGMSINVMTLGGLAVAMGELVDDAIVDVENVYRRLNENARLPDPRPRLEVVYEASVEIRSAIVYGTMLVILVFLPLFALSGIEGRMFAPLGVAYIVSILASLFVSLSVTPVLASLLLSDQGDHAPESDTMFTRWLKRLATPLIRLSLHRQFLKVALAGVAAAVLWSGWRVATMGSDFLPAFDEGAAQVNVFLPPGSSLDTSNRVSAMIDKRFQAHVKNEKNPKGLVMSFVRRSGRAELDEHAEGVNVTEYIVTMNPDSGVSRSDALKTLREELADIPGIESEVEQPLAHLISHMLSGVTAQIAIKLYGDDLDVLRSKAEEMKTAISGITGIAPPVVEQQKLIPQLRVELDRAKLGAYGVTPAYVNDFIETALNGKVVSTVLDGQRTFDLVVRLDDRYRTDIGNLNRLSLDLPDGGRIPLSAVARVYEGGGPNTIQRENVRRRITLRVNTTDRDLGSAVAAIRQAIHEKVKLPEGYFVEYGGQFEAQQEAAQRILLLSGISIAGIFLVLYTLYPSTRLVLQIMIAIPIAFVGGVAALTWTGQTLTVASMVGFISLGGISARNGILLLSHYLHLMREEGESFTEAMVLRGSLERLIPVLMTALTTGIGLIPLVVGGHAPGKEILYPVATVLLGGIVTSTICEYVIHPGLFFHLSGRDALELSRSP